MWPEMAWKLILDGRMYTRKKTRDKKKLNKHCQRQTPRDRKSISCTLSSAPNSRKSLQISSQKRDKIRSIRHTMGMDMMRMNPMRLLLRSIHHLHDMLVSLVICVGLSLSDSQCTVCTHYVRSIICRDSRLWPLAWMDKCETKHISRA